METIFWNYILVLFWTVWWSMSFPRSTINESVLLPQMRRLWKRSIKVSNTLPVISVCSKHAVTFSWLTSQCLTPRMTCVFMLPASEVSIHKSFWLVHIKFYCSEHNMNIILEEALSKEIMWNTKRCISQKSQTHLMRNN